MTVSLSGIARVFRQLQKDRDRTEQDTIRTSQEKAAIQAKVKDVDSMLAELTARRDELMKRLLATTTLEDTLRSKMCEIDQKIAVIGDESERFEVTVKSISGPILESDNKNKKASSRQSSHGQSAPSNHAAAVGTTNPKDQDEGGGGGGGGGGDGSLAKGGGGSSSFLAPVDWSMTSFSQDGSDASSMVLHHEALQHTRHLQAPLTCLGQAGSWLIMGGGKDQPLHATTWQSSFGVTTTTATATARKKRPLPPPRDVVLSWQSNEAETPSVTPPHWMRCLSSAPHLVVMGDAAGDLHLWRPSAANDHSHSHSSSSLFRHDPLWPKAAPLSYGSDDYPLEASSSSFPTPPNRHCHGHGHGNRHSNGNSNSNSNETAAGLLEGWSPVEAGSSHSLTPIARECQREEREREEGGLSVVGGAPWSFAGSTSPLHGGAGIISGHGGGAVAPSMQKSAISSLIHYQQTVAAGNVMGGIQILDASQGGGPFLSLAAHHGYVRSLQLYEYALASGGRDGLVRMWDLRSGDCHRTLTAHAAGVQSMVLTETLLATGGMDGYLRIFDLRTGLMLNEWSSLQQAPITSLCFVDRTRFVAGTNAGYLHWGSTQAGNQMGWMGEMHAHCGDAVLHLSQRESSHELLSASINGLLHCWNVDQLFAE
jgi:WD40 repeat protein